MELGGPTFYQLIASPNKEKESHIIRKESYENIFHKSQEILQVLLRILMR